MKIAFLLLVLFLSNFLTAQDQISDISITVDNNSPYDLLVVGQGAFKDTLYNTDGELKVIACNANNLDTIDVIYRHTYREPYISHEFHFISFYFLPDKGCYRSRDIYLYGYGVRKNEKADKYSNVFKDFNVESDSFFSVERRIGGSDKYELLEINVLQDVRTIKSQTGAFSDYLRIDILNIDKER